MANINVNRAVNDPFYRYKMPKIVAKIEGKGNGIKTVIANMSDIAKALERPATYPTKYFGCVLGAQTTLDVKNDRYIVNGCHAANKLQEILDGFIKKFVLCPACDNPETTLTVKTKTIHGKCKACGHAFIIDPKQKLSTFILKNPPPCDANESESKEKKESVSPSPDESLGNFDLTNTPAEISNDDNLDNDWSESMENGAQHLSSGTSKLVQDNDLKKPEDDRLDMLLDFFEKAKVDESIKFGKKMLNEAERLELKDKAPLLLCQVIFDKDVLKQIEHYRTLLLHFCLKDQKAQKSLLHGIEILISNHTDTLLPKAAHILKKLYDEDICSEEVIVEWGSKPSNKFVKLELSKQILVKCRLVLKWLEEASEESESEEEDGVVEFNDRPQQTGTVRIEAGAEQVEVDGEEIDIDDI